MSNSETSNSEVLDHSKTHRAKFFQRWPRLKELYDDFERKGVVIDYSKEMEIKESLDKEIGDKLAEVWSDDAPKKSFRRTFSSFLSNKKSKAEDQGNDRFIFLILDNLTSHYLDNSYTTEIVPKYYALRTFQSLRQYQLSRMHTKSPRLASKVPEGVCKDDDIKWFETEMTFISAFFNKELLTLPSFISSELDDLAEQVLELLREKNPSNPLLNVSKGTLKKWHSEGFSSNKFDDHATREILDCQCELFKKLGFEVDNEDERDLMDMYEVLETKRGNWQVIFAIFMGVAHRLGVFCRFLGIRNGEYECDLGWKSSKENVDKTSEKKYFALNIFECTKSQHEEVSCCEEEIEEIFEVTIVYRKIPDVIYGELRDELISIIDDQTMVAHKYRLDDSSDEDERFGQYTRCEGFDESSNEEKSSGDDEGPRCDIFGFLGNDYGRIKKRKSDKIAIHEGKFYTKLDDIKKKSQMFEMRKRLRDQQRENKKLKEEIAASRSQDTKK